MKKLFALVLAVAVSMMITGAASAATTIKLAHAGSLEHQYHIGAEIFKKLVEERSGGNIKVNIFPQAQLGNERDSIEGVRMGTINMTTIAAAGALPSFVPEMSVLAIPYVLQNAPQAYAVLDGPFGAKLNSIIAGKGLKNLAYWEVGFRHFTNNIHPIKTPADIKDLKIRVQESKSWMEMIQKMGGIPTPVPFGELYSALQQKVVDGQENPIASIYSMKYYEVQKYMTLDGHTYEAAAVLVNPKWFESLAKEEQDLIIQAAIDAGKEQRATLAKLDEERLAEIQKAGVEVFTTPDIKAFADATKDVWKTLDLDENLVKEFMAAAEQAAQK